MRLIRNRESYKAIIRAAAEPQVQYKQRSLGCLYHVNEASLSLITLQN
jgi:hypothetical protein